MRTIGLLALATALCLAIAPGVAQEHPAAATAAETPRPSIADTQKVSFDGKEFSLLYKADKQPVPVYEYYLQAPASQREARL